MSGGMYIGPGIPKLEAEAKILDGKLAIAAGTALGAACIALGLTALSIDVERFGWRWENAVTIAVVGAVVAGLVVLWKTGLGMVRDGRRTLRDLEARESEEPRP